MRSAGRSRRDQAADEKTYHQHRLRHDGDGDNGPAHISGKLGSWATKRGVQIQHVQPQQNAYVERYNRTVRQEWLDQQIIDSIEKIQNYATQWLWTYNNEHPNMGFAGITPA